MKKVSVYVKGDRNSTAYYRIYQYFDRLNDIDVSYHLMYPLWVQKNFMPVPNQHIIMQGIIFLCALANVFFALLRDYTHEVDIIVIHKRLLSRFMPFSFKWMLKKMSERGTKVIWDFDDHIVEGKEMSQKTFDFFSKISNRIVVTHDYLKALVLKEYHDKVDILPTTDGDLYEYYHQEELMTLREELFSKQLILVWVATSSNIKNLLPVLPTLDKVAESLLANNKKLVLKVVCDKSVQYDAVNLEIVNIKWTRERAIDAMKAAHIGIMPLQDTEYNKGKGGFKLVQYLSIGLPCIGSDIGFNKQVIPINCGVLANNNTGWENAILKLSEAAVWKFFSEQAYMHWWKAFSYQRNLDFWENLIITYCAQTKYRKNGSPD